MTGHTFAGEEILSLSFFGILLSGDQPLKEFAVIEANSFQIDLVLEGLLSPGKHIGSPKSYCDKNW